MGTLFVKKLQPHQSGGLSWEGELNASIEATTKIIANEAVALCGEWSQKDLIIPSLSRWLQVSLHKCSSVQGLPKDH